LFLSRDSLQRAVQVAVVTMRVVQCSLDRVVDVVPVRNGVVPALASVVALALDRSAAPGSTPIDLEAVLVGMGFVRRVKVPVVEVVGVVSVTHRPVAAIRPMLVRM
jgi:hypothetical protein